MTCSDSTSLDALFTMSYNDGTTKIDNPIAMTVQATPLLAVTSITMLYFLFRPGPVTLVCSDPRSCRMVAFTMFASIFAIGGLMLYQTFDLYASCDASSSVISDLRYPLIALWGLLFMFHVFGLCSRKMNFLVFLDLLVMAFILAADVMLRDTCVVCASLLFPLQLTCASAASLSLFTQSRELTVTTSSSKRSPFMVDSMTDL